MLEVCESIVLFFQILRVILIALFFVWVLPSIALLVKDEISDVLGQLVDMWEDDYRARHRTIIRGDR